MSAHESVIVHPSALEPAPTGSHGLMRRNPETGMALIDTTVVVLVLGILAAIVIPNVNLARSSYRLQLVSSSIRDQLYLCRQRALVANQTCTMRISTTTGKAQIDTNFNGAFGDSGGNGIPADDTATTLDLSGVTVQSLDTPIIRRFTSRGEVPWQDNPTSQNITVIYEGIKRVITIEQRGSVVVSEEMAAN